MEKKVINQIEAIKLLEAEKDISDYTIELNEEKIEALQAILLGKNNIKIPEYLIYYDDDSIDFSDDPDLTDEDLKTGKISWNIVRYRNKRMDKKRKG